MLTGIPSAADRTPPASLEDALVARYTGFAGWLRANDFHVTSSDVAASLEVAQRMGQLDSELLRWSLRALLCSRAEEWRRFDALFEAYFLAPNRRKLGESRAGGAGRIETGDTAGRRDASEGTPLGLDGPGATDPDQAPGKTAEQGASVEASLAHADFRHLNQPDELFAIDDAIRRFAQRLQGIQLRREQRANNGRVVDMAWTIRRSVSRGGMPLELGWRRKRRQRPRIVLLLDVSRSMSLYSFFYLRLARVLSARVSDVHCFISTRGWWALNRRCGTPTRGARRNACSFCPQAGQAAHELATASANSTSSTQRNCCTRAPLW
jgi:uncharacterized protein with von Willebrand factor type A (vWA) domain